MIQYLTGFLRVIRKSILNAEVFVKCVTTVVVRHERIDSLEICQRKFDRLIELFDQKIMFKKGEIEDPEVLEVLSDLQYP